MCCQSGREIAGFQCDRGLIMRSLSSSFRFKFLSGYDRSPRAPWRTLLALTILGMAAPGFSFLSALGQAQTSGAPPRIEWIDVHVHLIGGRGAWRDYEGAVSAALAVMEEA